MARTGVGRHFLRGVVCATVLAVTVGLAGCSSLGRGSGATDAAGMTRGEADALSLEAQFDLVEQRDARMRELLTEAQEQISTDVW